MPARRLRLSSRPPRPSRAPLYFLLLLLGATLLAIRFAGRSQTWNWMFQNSTAKSAAAEREEKVESISVTPAAPPSNISGSAAQTAPLPAEMWDVVTDGEMELSPEEQPIVQSLLQAAKDIRANGEPLGRTDVRMADLNRHPDEHRGERISLEGTLRLLQTCNDRLVVDSAGPLQQGWLFTADSGTMPYRVVTLEAPMSLPQGRRIEVPAKTTGYFFKLSGYQTAAGINVAPLLIGRNWRIEIPATSRPDSTIPSGTFNRVILTVLLGSTLALTGLMRFFARKPRRRAFSGRHE